MAPATRFFGWQVVMAALVLAVFTWGISFYGPSVYLHALHERQGWPASLISMAITLHFLASSAVLMRLSAVLARLGGHGMVRLGAGLTALGLLAWGLATQPWHLVPAACLTGAGFALCGGAAINALLSPWFDRRRAAALAMAYNGASLGGVVFSPLWAVLIDRFGFAWAAAAVAAATILVIWPLAGRWFRPTAADLGLHPDGAATAPAPRPVAAVTGPLWRESRFQSLAAGFALPLAAQMGLLIVLYTLLARGLGPRGAGLALSLTTVCAIVGRTLTGVLLSGDMDRRRLAVANFLLQAAGSLALMLAADRPALLLLGTVLFGLGVGNMLSLPPLIIQVEWPAAETARVVATLTAFTQTLYAFAPALFGAAFDAFGPWAPPALALGLQLAGVLALGWRRQ